MKKILIILLVVTALLTTSNVQAQKVKYYYYPATNVYYNPVTKQYAYINNGAWNWYNTAPATISGQRRVLVYHTNEAVWVDNSTHAAKYKVTPVPKGKAVGYKGTNPNRKSGNATGYKGTNTNRKSGNATGHKGSNPNRQAGKVKVKSKG